MPPIPQTSATYTDTLQALSRREEDEFLKRAKIKALRTCDPVVSEFAKCSSTRTFSVVWACREQWKAVQSCVKEEMSEEKLDPLRLYFIKHRDEFKVPYTKLGSYRDDIKKSGG